MKATLFKTVAGLGLVTVLVIATIYIIRLLHVDPSKQLASELSGASDLLGKHEFAKAGEEF